MTDPLEPGSDEALLAASDEFQVRTMRYLDKIHGGGVNMGDALTAGSAFAAESVLLGATHLTRTIKVAQTVEATLAEVQTSAKHLGAVSSRLDRLYRPRGLMLVGGLIVLSNLVAALAGYLVFVFVTYLFDRLTVPSAFSESLAIAIIIAILGWTAKVLVTRLRSLLRDDA